MSVWTTSVYRKVFSNFEGVWRCASLFSQKNPWLHVTFPTSLDISVVPTKKDILLCPKVFFYFFPGKGGVFFFALRHFQEDTDSFSKVITGVHFNEDSTSSFFYETTLSSISLWPTLYIFNRCALSTCRSFVLNPFCLFLHMHTQYCADVCMHKLTIESTLAISDNVKVELGKTCCLFHRALQFPYEWVGRNLPSLYLWVTGWAHGDTGHFCSSNHPFQLNTQQTAFVQEFLLC